MPAIKRASSALTEGRRRSGRLSSTPKKSSYFEEAESDTEDVALTPKKRGRPPKKKQRRSLAAEESEDLYEEGTEDQGDEDAAVEQHDDDDSDDDDDDGGSRKVKIIPLIKLRDEGGVEYEDHKLHKNSVLFLRDLKANNQRPWLKSHDAEYRRAWKDWVSFVERTTQTVAEVDETVPELPSKDVIFRIYRDIRFSKDPTPYKPHFSSAWSRTGRKGPYACYYVHCEHKRSFVGGGLWHPDKMYVDRLRRSIDRHPERWRRVLSEPAFCKYFQPKMKAKDGPGAAVRGFIEHNASNMLKKRPAGWDMSHPNIGLLRLKNYTASVRIDDDTFCRDDAQEKLADIFRALSGLVEFLNDIVMPDPRLEGLDDSDDSDDEEEGDEDEQDDEEEDGDELA